MARAWASVGLVPPPDACLYRSLYLNQWPAGLQAERIATAAACIDLRPVAFGVGARLPVDLEHLGRARPLVYVTFGTVFGNPDAITTIPDGLAGVDVDVLVTTGPDTTPEPVEHINPNACVRSFVPQGAVLDRCALAVTHGGARSVIGALAHGVPLLVIPTGADQVENAVAVSAAGVGRRLEPLELTARSAPEAAVGMLADDTVRRAATTARGEIAAMPPPEAVVPVLEALAATG